MFLAVAVSRLRVGWRFHVYEKLSQTGDRVEQSAATNCLSRLLGLAQRVSESSILPRGHSFLQIYFAHEHMGGTIIIHSPFYPPTFLLSNTRSLSITLTRTNSGCLQFCTRNAAILAYHNQSPSRTCETAETIDCESRIQSQISIHSQAKGLQIFTYCDTSIIFNICHFYRDSRRHR